MSNIGNKETFAENLAYYVGRSGRTQKELSEIVGVSTSTFNDWMKAKKYPRIDKVEILADYFRILKSDLIEKKTTEDREMQKKNAFMVEAVQRMRTDEVFLEAVESLYNMDQAKLLSLLTLLK